MTTEPVSTAQGLKAMSIALALWFGGMIMLTPVLEPTRDVLVFSPVETIAALPAAGVALLDVSGSWARVRRTEAGFVRRLYAQGAWIVLPAFEGGCNRTSGIRAVGRV
jgi:hypothetical protein